MTEKFDPVKKPAHYNQGNIQPIDVIEDWKCGFCIGNALKYLARANHKGSRIQDLEKAIWYIEREIQNVAQQEREKTE